MALRVCDRLKTKDRAIGMEDYSRLIRQEFGGIYYVKPVPDKDMRTAVYLVKAYGSSTDPNAFTPMVSECTEEKMNKFLHART